MPDTISIETLRALAHAASSAPWFARYDGVLEMRNVAHYVESSHRQIAYDIRPEDAAYIAAANPDIVLRLLDVAERAMAYEHAVKNISSETGYFAAPREALAALHESLAPFRAAAEIARQASDRGGER
jgi:hypothetical protein